MYSVCCVRMNPLSVFNASHKYVSNERYCEKSLILWLLTRQSLSTTVSDENFRLSDVTRLRNHVDVTFLRAMTALLPP